MKKLNILLIALLGIVFLFSCEENEKVTIDDENTTSAVLTAPTSGTSYVLTEETADELFETFTWSAANYSDIQLSISYRLEMDYSDSSFASPKTLYTGELLTSQLTVVDMNNYLIGDGFEAETAVDVSFRVISYLTNNEMELISESVSVSVTPYEVEVIETNVNPLYLLGGGTSVGWNNDDTALPAVYLPESGADSTFAVVDLLSPAGIGESDGFLKFVRTIGAWAPQWGSDGAGTWESGNLVLRATEDDPDPDAIPCPDVAGDYIVKVDIVNLTYTIEETVETLHIIGDATEAVWDNTLAIPMEKIAPGKFQLVTNLSADAEEGFKFLELQGAWAPMLGQDGEGTFEGGKLQYRATENDTDPSSIPPPSVTGSYLIEVDLATFTYKVTAQ